jgi:hypothetical protein
MVGSGFHPHVWFAKSGDIFRRNIVWSDYRPALMPKPPWGSAMDYNLMHQEGASNSPAVRLQRQSGRDEHSIVADAQFINPAIGDYRVKEGSPAVPLGFVNFPMDQFGVRKPELKSIARQPVLPGQKSLAIATATRETSPHSWLGVTVRNIADEGEMSALGLPGIAGVLVLEVPATSALARAGLRMNDVILTINGAKARDVSTLARQVPDVAALQSAKIGISRQQKQSVITVAP